ncbi:ABC transporter ATP-binding protein [Candidimonas nitroreducens]|uniref:ABC transporter ATP-binding protein n=1 Tax=Candidimonas nitroreducens TaxID=683354 RepID=UPI0018E98160|nr:ABC transporter ATP-binding protein [Candidimonas nitroreducens]
MNLDIGDGEFLCVLGPSGCGKTTTLRMIAGLEHPTSGEIRIGEQVVDSVAKGTYVPPEKRGMGFVFQSYALWPHLSVQDNVEFGLALRKVDRKARRAASDAVMEKLGIAKYRDRYPSDLSGGQQQRVALARMLVVRPSVILMDEPLSNLDAKLRLEMRAELKRIHLESKATVVFVTHDQWEAMTLASMIAVMSEGTLQQFDTPDNIYNRPCNRFVAGFVGSPPMNFIELGAGEASELSTTLRKYLDGAGLGACRGSVGIRPESLCIGAPSGSTPAAAYTGCADVTGIMPTGGNWIIELSVAGQKLFATTNTPPHARLGDEISFWADRADLHLFDESGNRLPDDATLGAPVSKQLEEK